MAADPDHPPKKAPMSRAELLARSLRENLLRRKAQARARAAGEPGRKEADAPHDSAGIVPDKPAR